MGAGVVGLSCALRLLRAGHRVDVLARDLPLETTSSVAAAIWYPYLALPQDKVTAWGKATYDEFARLAARGVDGVAMRSGTELLHRADTRSLVDRRRAGPRARRAPPAVRRRLVVRRRRWSTCPATWPWLAEQVQDAGGTITRMALARLPEAPLVVNCSGLGSRALAADTSTTPVRGQVVVVEQIGLEEWWLAEGGPTYVVPRTHRHRPGRHRRGGRLEPEPVAADGRRHPPPGGRAGARGGGCPRAPAQGGAPTRSPGGAAGAGRRRDPLLRPRWRRRDVVVGLCGRGRHACGRIAAKSTVCLP